MRRLLSLVFAMGLVLVGCGSSSSDTSTDDIPPPTAKTGQAVTPNTDHAGHETSTCSPSGTTLTIVAQNTKFSTDCLAAPADTPFTLSFENKDAVAHNIVLLVSHSSADVLFRADIFTGPKTSSFTTGPFKAGTYAFHCEVHPQLMSGTFIVK